MPRSGKSYCTGDLERLARPAVQHPALCQQLLAQLLKVLRHTRNNSLVSAYPTAAFSPFLALSQKMDMGSTWSPLPSPGTELRNAPLWVCNTAAVDGISLGQHLPVPAWSYKGQLLLSVFDPAEHPHLRSHVPADTDPTMLRPNTG